MKYYYDTFSTPMGEFSVAVDEAGAVVATTFGSAAGLGRRLDEYELVRNAQRTARARREITEFFRGSRRRFTLALAPSGTPFQKRAWSILERIPFGETRTYGQIAEELGGSRLARAVGRASAANPVCLLVPCHRVVGAGGALTGFAYGTELKRRLLQHEETGSIA
jgi:methylated-DNA-[protein]-cysteine S-methyltransferase